MSQITPSINHSAIQTATIEPAPGISAQSLASPTAPIIPSIKIILPHEAQILIENNRDDPNFIIIDIRTPEEFNSGYIAGAINIDYRSDNFRSQTVPDLLPYR